MKFLSLFLLMVVSLLSCNRTNSDSSGSHFQLPQHLIVYHTTNTAADAPQEAVPTADEPIPTINAEQFAKLVKSPEVLMELFAPWCQSCKELAPEIVELHKRRPNLPIYKINVDNESDLATANNVAFVPTLILFRHGHRVGSLSGYYDLNIIERFLQSDAI